MTETVSFCCPNSCESQGARFNDMQLVLWIIEGQRITFNSINVKGGEGCNFTEYVNLYARPSVPDKCESNPLGRM